MPSIDGGDQCGKDYAPHMWIGDNFVSGTRKRVRVGEWFYHVGATADETVVAERYPVSDGEYEPRHVETVPNAAIPPEVLAAISTTAFADRQAEVAGFEKLFNG